MTEKFSKKLKKAVTNTFNTHSARQTQKLGEELAKSLKGGDVVFLKGDLGAGKTTFTQGLVKAFGNKRFLGSASFTLVNEYKAKDAKLFHIDLYRLSPSNIFDIGLDEYLDGENISVIEWPERLGDAQNIATYIIELEYGVDNERKITINKKAGNK